MQIWHNIHGDNMSIKEIRNKLNLTQKEASELTKIPLRTYINYENDTNKKYSIKYQYIMEKLVEYGKVDEENGLLSIEKIKEICTHVFKDYDVEFCYLFGSYAKHKENEKSDVDLLICTTVSGLSFYGLVEELRINLHKKVDLLSLEQLVDNLELIHEILKDGIKIYERSEG